MADKLTVAFDDPLDGWVGLSLSRGREAVVIVASYTPYDSFLDLVNTLSSVFLFDGESKAIWNEEPVEYELRFGRAGSLVSLEVLEFPDHRRELQQAQSRLNASGSYEEVAIPFWRALRNLQGRFTAGELDARWHRPFPSKEIEGLTSIVQRTS